MKKTVIILLCLVTFGVSNMKKILFITVILFIILYNTAISKDLYKYYITASFICKEPVISYGTSRLDALTKSGITVWTEEEWNGQYLGLKKDKDEK